MKPFLKEVAESLIAKYGDGIQELTIVFNNKRPASYLQKHLADGYQKPFWSPTFLTIQEFFASVTPLKIADFYTQFFTLYDCWIELIKAEKQANLPSIAKFHAIAKIILSDFAQLDNDLVNANQLFAELEDIAVINKEFDFLTDEQKAFLADFWQSYNSGRYKQQQEQFIKMWRRMPQLYKKFHQQLAQAGYTTMPQVYRNVANGSHNLDFTQQYQGNKLVFVGLNALSKAEAKAFKRWQSQDKAIFYFDADSYYLNDEIQEAGLFLRRNLNQIGLINQLAATNNFFTDKDRPIGVYKTQGQVAQAKIINHLVDFSNTDLDKKGQTAIVLADENLLIPLLQTIPAQVATENVAVNVTMGISLVQSSLFGLIDLWLQVQAHLQSAPQFVGHQMVQSFLSHPLTGIADKKRYQIHNKLIEEQLVDIPVQRLLKQGGIIGLFFKQATKANMVSCLTAVLTHIVSHAYQEKWLKKLDASLFEKAIQELNCLGNTLTAYFGRYGDRLEPSFILLLIKQAMTGLSVPLEGDTLDGIQVMGLLETRNLNFGHVVVLGLNEGVVPKTSTPSTFIPDSLRRAYGLPVLENQDAISAYMFYRLLQRTNRVDLVYNNLTDENTSGEPSRFIKQLAYESGFSFIEKELFLPIKTEIKRTEVIEKTPRVQQELNKFLTGERKLSASALTTYILNPIDFFYKYLAGIDEPKEIEESIEPKKVGLIMHYVMEYFYADLLNEDSEITAERINAHRKVVPDLILEGFADSFYVPAEADKRESKEQRRAKVLHLKSHLQLNGMQKVIFAIIKEYIDIILRFDIQRAPFKLVSLEQKDSVAFNFEVNGQAKQVKLLGIIDRVDFKDGVYRIVDYKSGGDVLKYSTVSDCFNSDGSKINKALVQTLFYTYVYEQLAQVEGVEPNLYVVRTMGDPTIGVAFDGKSGVLTGQCLASEKQIFVDELKAKLAELFDYNKPFKLSATPTNYQYSIYKDLMGV